jgi:hypothetical protein
MASLSRSRAVLVMLAFATSVGASAPSSQNALEYQVKAAYLGNFAQLVEWPATAFSHADEPFRVCVFGNDPFGQTLDRTLEGDRVAGHPIVVQRIKEEGPLTGCRILFVPAQQMAQAAKLLQAVRRRPVLTVGESPQFLERGGAINLVVEGGRVRFDVNLDGAAPAGLKIGSKLLRVARSVQGKGSGS